MKQNRFEQWAKRKTREFEARMNPFSQSIKYRGSAIRLQRSLFWQGNLAGNFFEEISPYHDSIEFENEDIRVVVDAGAAEGHFSVSTAVLLSKAIVYAFEPSDRQRIMLQRNARLNNVDSRIHITPAGLYSRTGRLAFRTAGAASFLEAVEENSLGFPCFEKVPVVRLDDWRKENKIDRIDLIKMDIEGAEIEALEGGLKTLEDLKPTCLVQAYHIRGGVRTFEKCSAILKSVGYDCKEWPDGSGMIVGKPK